MKRALFVLFALVVLAVTAQGVNGEETDLTDTTTRMRTENVADMVDSKGETRKSKSKKAKTTDKEEKSWGAPGIAEGGDDLLDNANSVTNGKLDINEANIIRIILFAFFGVIILIIIIILIKMRKNRGSDMDNDDMIEVAGSDRLERLLDKRFNDLESRIDNLSEKITRLLGEQREGSFELRNGTGVAAPHSLVSRPASPPAQPQVVERPKEIFYFANPVGDSFKTEKKLQNPEEALYRFERFIDESRAKVFVVEEPRVARRFTDRPEAQDKVCDDEGNFSTDAKNVQTVMPGFAVLEGDKWRVTQKVKIKYIA